MDKNRKLISDKPENYKYIVFDPNYQGVILTSNDYNEVRNFAQNNKGVHIKYQDTTPKYNNLVAPTLINRPTRTNRNAYFNQLKNTPDVVILDDKQIERNRAQRQYEENQRRIGVVSKRQDTLRSTEEAEAEQKAKDAYATIQATYNPMAPGYFSANSNTVTPEQAQREITQFYNTTPLGQLTRATAVGSLGGMAFEALPAAAQGALNLEMAYQGAKNLLSDNGVSKTWNKFKSGDYVGGLKSLGGDLFDFTLTIPVASKMLSIGKNSLSKAGDFIFTPPILNQKPSIWQRIFKYKAHPMTIKKLEKEAPGLFNENELSWMKLSEQERNEIMTNAVQEFYEKNIYPNLIKDAKQLGYTQDVIPKNVFYGKTSFGSNLPLVQVYFPTRGAGGMHRITDGGNYVLGKIVRWSPRFVPYKLMQLWDKSRGTSINNIKWRYDVPQKDTSIGVAIHEAGSHGTDNLTIYNKSPFGKSLYNMLDFRTPDFNYAELTPWEVRATINEFKFKNPNWKKMTFDDFIRNKQAFTNTNGYSGGIYISSQLNKKLDHLYNTIMNTYANGGKLKNDNINDNTELTTKHQISSQL